MSHLSIPGKDLVAIYMMEIRGEGETTEMELEEDKEEGEMGDRKNRRRERRKRGG